MESWYGLLWNHRNRHGELLRGAEQERLANDLRRRYRHKVQPWTVSLLGLTTLLVLLTVLRMA